MVQAIAEGIAQNHHQVDVVQGGIIRANKAWKNVGGDGNRDVYVLYGQGTTGDTFVTEFAAAVLGQYCAAGAQVTTPVDCEVPPDATPGLKNALVAVGGYVYPTIVYDDYEIVEHAINVVVLAPIGEDISVAFAAL